LCDGPAVSRHEDIAETSPRLLHTIHAHTPPPPPQQPHILLHAPALTTVPSVLASESVHQREDLWKLNPQGNEKRYVGARFRRWRRGLWDWAFSAIWYETTKDGSFTSSEIVVIPVPHIKLLPIAGSVCAICFVNDPVPRDC
jgi:hypothetical protein